MDQLCDSMAYFLKLLLGASSFIITGTARAVKHEGWSIRTMLRSIVKAVHGGRRVDGDDKDGWISGKEQTLHSWSNGSALCSYATVSNLLDNGVVSIKSVAR